MPDQADERDDKLGCEALGFGVLCAYSDTVAILFISFVAVVLVISLGLHFLEQWIQRRFTKPSNAGLGAALLDAVSRIKEEFMITGMIALLLFAFGRKLEIATCTEYDIDDAGSSYSTHNHASVGSFSISKGPEPLSSTRPAGEHGRRLKAWEPRCLKSRLPVWDQEHAHILLLMAALVNAVYSTITVVIIMRRISSWRIFEKKMHQSAELLPIGDGTIKRITCGQLSFFWGCFFRQFFLPGIWKGVTYDAYHSARHCAMEYWKLVLCNQMLLKSKDQAFHMLQHHMQHVYKHHAKQPHRQMEFQMEMDGSELPDAIHAAMQRTHELTEASEILSRAASLEHHKKHRVIIHSLFSPEDSHALKQAAPDIAAVDRAEESMLPKDFERSYRLKVKQFEFIGFVQRLAADQFAEDRIMAFAQPLVIGIFLLFPHNARIFAWLPPFVFLVMTILGWELQCILMELTRRYHYLYKGEYHRIKARLRWRNAVAQLVEETHGPRDWVKNYKHAIPEMPVIDEPALLKSLSRRDTNWHRGERVDTALHFLFSSPKLMKRVFLFCHYSNAFFLSMVLFTGWMEHEDFRQHLGTLLYMGVFSVAAMLHGALNINPLFALITSSSSYVPHQFAEKWEQEQLKTHAIASNIVTWIEETKKARKAKKAAAKQRDIEAQSWYLKPYFV